MKSSRSGQVEGINITPLTDVFLVLLIIMMLVAPLVDLKGLDMAVLDLGPSQSTEESKQVLVEVTANAEYRVDGKTVAPDDLTAAVKELSATKPDGVVIDADPDATHQATMIALAAVNLAGVKNIGMTEMAAETETPPDAGAAPGAPAPEDKKPAPAKKPKAKK
jgi:biopolymer transport protein ExbD/biopolymer transport protein TolR